MKTLDFLSLVWPANAKHYCLWIKSKRGPLYNRVFDTIYDAAVFAGQKSATDNVYYCMHTLKATSVIGSDGKSHQRTKENMDVCQVLFTDLDCGKDEHGKPKAYPDQPTALADIDRVVDSISIPQPMIVNSGNGWHIYWVLDRALGEAEWLPLATNLRNLFDKVGLKYDPSKIVDRTAVLRPPGTFNHKEETHPVALHSIGAGVVSTDYMQKILLQAQAVQPQVSQSQTLPPSAPEFGDNTSMRDLGEKVTMAEVRAICPQMKRISNELGKSCREPEWRVSLGVAAYTSTADAGHKISKGHPGYERSKCQRSSYLCLYRYAGRP
jgi:hypothetical protein